MQTVKLNIFGMHCTSCAINIDGELEDTEGVKEAKTNYARQVTTDAIISVIKKIDDKYDAEVASK